MINLKIKYHWLLLITAIVAFYISWLFSPSFVAHYFSVNGELSTLSRAQVNLFQYIIAAFATLLTIVWLMRNKITSDILYVRYKLINRKEDPLWETYSFTKLLKFNAPEVFVLSLLVAWFLLVNISFYNQVQWPKIFLGESGILENLTVGFYAISALLGLKVFMRHRRATGLFRWYILCLSVFCILIALEETNWGQIYIQYDSPGFFKILNKQEDTSIHNLKLPSFIPIESSAYWANDASWWLSVIAVLTASLVYSFKSLYIIFKSLEIPLPPILSIACFGVAALLVRNDDLQFGWQMRPSEMREFTIALAFLFWTAREVKICDK